MFLSPGATLHWWRVKIWRPMRWGQIYETIFYLEKDRKERSGLLLHDVWNDLEYQGYSQITTYLVTVQMRQNSNNRSRSGTSFNWKSCEIISDTSLRFIKQRKYLIPAKFCPTTLASLPSVCRTVTIQTTSCKRWTLSRQNRRHHSDPPSGCFSLL